MEAFEHIRPYLPHVATFIAVADFLIILITLPWILTIKKESASAMAWILIVILVPLVGFVLFFVFGYTHVYRPLKKKRRHRAGFRVRSPATRPDATRGHAEEVSPKDTYQGLGRIAIKLGAFPVSAGNEVTFYHETKIAFAELMDVIKDARHHIHAEFFIIQPDETGQAFLDLLIQKARAGVEVRLLYDAVGCRRLPQKTLRTMCGVGGRCSAFLPLNVFRRQFQINLRNHRKIVVIDGRIAFTGGMNIGDEYLGKDEVFGYWRDSFLRLEGPAVAGVQRIFAEDWDFCAKEILAGDDYFPELPLVGDAVVQMIDSGPDEEPNSMRELIFSAIAVARERIWISTPYLVPDRGIFDALIMAARFGVDVRIIWLLRPDHYLPYYAARYYIPDLLKEGVKLYQYSKGMMHAKMMMIDGMWGWLGSTNIDNRSLVLNFEANCIIHSPELVKEMEEAFRHDLKDCIRLEGRAFADRPYAGRLIENGCRLFAPFL